MEYFRVYDNYMTKYIYKGRKTINKIIIIRKNKKTEQKLK